MRALVTGGAGFIGSHLIDRLLAGGAQVIALDDFSTGCAGNLEQHSGHPRLVIVGGNAADDPLVESLVADVDVVFHLASPVGVRLVWNAPVTALASTVECGLAVLGAASRHRRPVVITSSSDVYGVSTDGPLREGDSLRLPPPTSRRWHYAAGKLAIESLALAHWQETRLPVVCARLFNVTGPRQLPDQGMVLPRFVLQAVRGRCLEIHGDGGQTRSFLDVRDAVTALLALAVNVARTAGTVVNVGSEEEVTILDLAERVRRLPGARSEIVFRPYDFVWGPGFEDVQRRTPDLALLRALIDFEPAYDLNATIEAVAAYWRDMGKAPQALEE